MRCDKCPSRAVTFVRYSGSHLCKAHFNDFLDKRVKRCVREQTNLGKHRKVAVGVSGGKDSSVALYLMHKIMGARRGSELVAITVDEGIGGYRDRSIPYARRLSDELGIEHVTVTFRDVLGIEMDSIAGDGVLACSYCGVFRRHCLNIAAREAGAQLLATGLNLDDTVQSVLMNMARAEMPRLARMGPHEGVQDGLVPRIQPLREIPEKEVYLYALLNGISFYSSDCPYAESAMRGRFKSLVAELEELMPGTRHGILRAYDELRPLLLQKYPPAALGRCARCGEPTMKERCKACEMVDELKPDPVHSRSRKKSRCPAIGSSSRGPS